MTRIGSYEAKTHLPELLARVERGERLLITRHGHAIAMLVPPVLEQPTDVREVIQKLKALSKGNMLGPDLTIRDLIEEGRRFGGV